MDEFLEHYGTPRHSGRYPWGSGKDPYQKSVALKKYYNDLKAKGVSEKDIAKGMGFRSTKQLRAFVSISNSEIKKQQYLDAIKLKEKGYSNEAIGKALKPPMGESSVRNLLDPAKKAKSQVTENVANLLKSGIEKGKLMDVGEGSEIYYGISATKLNTAVEYLRQQGYKLYQYQNKQQGTDKYTNMKLLCPPDMTFSEMYQNRNKLGLPDDWTDDGGYTITKLRDPVQIDRSRIFVRYKEEGGDDRDGTIELRPGVEDLTLGDASYAQVRIGVEGGRYMKGMAFYSNDIPKGYDVVYNTNKPSGSPDDKVFKDMKDDPDNPFGASIKQHDYIGKDGVAHLSAINKVGAGDLANEEGKWDTWARKLPSQFLSKQPPKFAEQQLKALYDEKLEEFNELKNLTNPVVKRQLMMEFADSCDSASVSMHAAALPRQATKVIFPVPELKDNEIYAPSFKEGEEVALVRFPHGGTFEIPILKVVNPKNMTKDEKSFYQSIDAVGINKHVADRLSGADFDGDTVLVIPTSQQKIQSKPALKDLEGFDTKERYQLSKEDAIAAYPMIGKKVNADGSTISPQMKQTQMGIVSNLITDMTIRGAKDDELARAVKHSMVVIDSEKHHLDWKQSEIDNGIAELKQKYQLKEGGKVGGASTLLSAGTGKVAVDTYRERIDWETGKKVRETRTDDTYINAQGKEVHRQVKRPRLELTDDALTLSSGTQIEQVYGEHSNRLKRLAEEARREVGATKNTPISPSAKKIYAPEVASLNAKLNEVVKNKPLERAAQAIADKVVADKVKADPSLKADKDKYQKAKNQAMAMARARTGAERKVVDITDREWEAIQAGAVSSTTLARILTRADKDRVRQLATPRSSQGIGEAMETRIRMMNANGCSLGEIAEQLGVSPSTVSRIIKE